MHNGKEMRIHEAINLFTILVKGLHSQLVVTHLTERF